MDERDVREGGEGRGNRVFLGENKATEAGKETKEKNREQRRGRAHSIV